MTIRIAVLPGDGVGAEVLAGPIKLLEHIASTGCVEVTGPWPVGASAFAELGTGLPEQTLRACDDADAMFFGAAGEHPGVPIDDYRPELSIIGLRERYDLRVSIRNIMRAPEPEGAVSVSSVGAAGGSRPSSCEPPGNPPACDGLPQRSRPLIVLRNLLGGAYGDASTRTESDGAQPAYDSVRITPGQVRELTEMACDMVHQGLASEIVSVDKANLLATSRLWRSITTEVAHSRGVSLRHNYVDRMAFELAHDSVVADTVILTEGIFGDILSDLAAGRAGSIALCGSASVNPCASSHRRCVGLFEPVHGSAPRHSGMGRVNPSGAYLALAALLEWFPETAKFGAPVTEALTETLRSGPLTYDLAVAGSEPVGTEAFAESVNNRALGGLSKLL